MNPHTDEPIGVVTSRDPHEACDLEEQKSLLREALARLTPLERQVIETAFFGELTYEEVAARLQQPLGTVKTRVRAGLMKLRQALARTETAP
jgi:RNA polymerase sigma-70 factor (ECF subfamily)